MGSYGWKIAAGISVAVALVSTAAVASSLAPVAYGAGELTAGGTVGVGAGIITTLASIVSFVFSLLKSGQGGKVIADATDLLGPIVKGQADVSQAAVRVALFTLQLDRASKGDAAGLAKVHELAALILIAPKTGA